MSVGIKTSDGVKQVARNANPEVEEKLKELEALMEQAKGLRADLENYGLVRLSDSSAVTDSVGLALPASEKNPAIVGSLAYLLQQNQLPTVERYDLTYEAENPNIEYHYRYSFKYNGFVFFTSMFRKNNGNFAKNARSVIKGLPAALRPIDNVFVVCPCSSVLSGALDGTCNVIITPDLEILIDVYNVDAVDIYVMCAYRGYL